MHYRALTFLVLLVATGALADIYVFVDGDGVTHFSNVPVDDRYEILLTESRTAPATAIHPALLELSQRYDPLIRKAAETANVEPELLRAVIVVESAFDTNAVSEAGARGLMQLMPRTAKLYGVEDAFDPRENIQAGARYLRDLIDRYDDDYEIVLAAYNAGEDAVDRHGGRIPPFAETRDFVPKVLHIYQRLIELGSAG